MNKVAHLMKLAMRGWDHHLWYHRTRPVIQDAASHLMVSTDRFIDILAITSPRCSVTRNVRVTVSYITTGALPGDVIRSTRVALQHYEKTGEIRGPKTGAFARALRGDEDAIVLDTHMATAFDIDPRMWSRKGIRQSAARRVRVGAHKMGLTPAQFQAAVWAGAALKGRHTNVPEMHTAIAEEIHT